MDRVAVKMKLFKGFELEYKKRHNEIWPELSALLTETGITDYSIFLDRNTGDLFATFKIENTDLSKDLPKQEIMMRWWAYMSDIMETEPDYAPVSIPLEEVFYMP